jgi:hypothetical protein
VKLPLVAGVLALSACSILYNPNNLGDPQKPDAALDAPPDLPIDMPTDAPPDAPPDMPTDSPFDAPMLTVTSSTPATLVEGMGAGGSRAVVLVINGTNLIDPSIVIDQINDNGTMRTVPIDGLPVVSGDRTKAAIRIHVPVLTGTAEFMLKPMHLTITQFGFSTTLDVQITGLLELEPVAGTIDTASLRPLYSRAKFNNPVHFVGANAAKVRVTSDIEITDVVDVDGILTVPGANGCAPGGPAGTGGCEGMGGAKGVTVAITGYGAGGGGFGTVGNPGAGANGAAGGPASGDALLANLSTPAGTFGNRGNGGGGGGTATTGAGGAGGAGGGVLELTADGAISVSGTGRVRAKGGDSSEHALLGTGDGGGGSGGAIVLRSGAGITATAGFATAPGGASLGNGGAGGSGRIRIDTPNAITGFAIPAPARGAVWATTAPTIVTTTTTSAVLLGATAQAYGIYLNGVAQANATTVAGMVTVPVAGLNQGANTLCATVAPGVSPLVLESSRCITITYVAP